jgi:NAD(P)-dependent dehydrogenase (short-subunit alcohol dehydrogenase family)
MDIEVAAFEESWRKNCLCAFIVGREAARAMVPTGNGTIIFAGAPSGLVGRPGYLTLAVGKFGLRALAQVMARELGPRGIHVAHLIIDAHIDDGEPLEPGAPVMLPDEIAQLAYQLHMQPRSSWTHELDARPWNERFWERC